MNIPNPNKIYPITNDFKTIYLKNVIHNSNISIGDFTIYNDFQNEPKDFEKNNVLYYHSINSDKLIIGKFCSISCGAKFIMTSANHDQSLFSTYPFPILSEEWDKTMETKAAFDKKGDIVIGNDVWIGYEAVIMSGVHIGDGAIIGTRAVVTEDVPPFAIVEGSPAKIINMRYDDIIINTLLNIKWWTWDIEYIQKYLPNIIGCSMNISNIPISNE